MKKKKIEGGEKREENKTVSQTPKKERKPQALHVTLSREGRRKPYKKVRQFYCLGDGESHLPSDRETYRMSFPCKYLLLHKDVLIE